MNYYRQCKLAKKDYAVDTGPVGVSILPVRTQIQTSWIPEQYAHEGNFIKLKKDGSWDDGWKVIEVGVRESEEYILGHERDYKSQRKASDI